MRIAGMISAVLVLIAVGFGLYSLVDFGFQAGEIFGILWPVAVGVTVLAFALLGFGRWSADMLNRKATTQEHDESQK